MVVDMQAFSWCVRILANGFPIFFRTCSLMTLHVVNQAVIFPALFFLSSARGNLSSFFMLSSIQGITLVNSVVVRRNKSLF